LRGGGPSTTLNCGYGHGYSVLETIEAVRRVSGRNFAVQTAPRRPGDIIAMVADTRRIASTLDWTPQYADLDTIAAHALAWEEKLFRDRHGTEQFAASA
jgi:UDP-glucose 4-epimerase